MKMTSENPEPNRRWFHPTPGILLLVLLAAEGILLLANWFQWIPKGWAVLIAVASFVATMVLMFLWFIASLIFHWRFQFSIRSLLILTSIVAILSSRLAVEVKKAKKQLQAVEAIRKAGGVVYYFYDKRDADGNEFVGEEMPRPVWLQALVGKARVCLVNFNDAAAKISDTDLKHVEELTDLQRLFLENTLVTDTGLMHIEGLSELTVLSLDGTPITDSGLGHIHDLPRLEFVTLTNTKVTGKGIEKLKRALPNCEIKFEWSIPEAILKTP